MRIIQSCWSSEKKSNQLDLTALTQRFWEWIVYKKWAGGSSRHFSNNLYNDYEYEIKKLLLLHVSLAIKSNIVVLVRMTEVKKKVCELTRVK